MAVFTPHLCFLQSRLEILLKRRDGSFFQNRNNLLKDKKKLSSHFREDVSR